MYVCMYVRMYARVYVYVYDGCMGDILEEENNNKPPSSAHSECTDQCDISHVINF